MKNIQLFISKLLRPIVTFEIGKECYENEDYKPIQDNISEINYADILMSGCKEDTSDGSEDSSEGKEDTEDYFGQISNPRDSIR